MVSIDLHPYTLVVSSFIVLALRNFISFIGKNSVQEFVWSLFVKFGSRFGVSKSFIAYSAKKEELHKVNKEKKAISAQDQYAKWTKLNRQSDKLSAELKSLEEVIAQNKNSVNRLVGLLITVLTTVPLWFFRIWFRKSVLFYLPTGVFPFYVERVFALPFFPSGAVGLTVWIFAVNSVVSSVLFLVSFLFETKPPFPELKQKVEEVKEEKTSSKPELIEAKTN
ncbi:coiled-coil membrane protein [Scheffersomyces xylosifermentans]|uniref:coiled-coil membrane protein n=1 Tax=Scheffersomyces xylosifermentans TaxID=1304137 RepID=UPI00315D9084